MAKNRDDFKKTTIEILAKRVGYKCSNPSCDKQTIGPNDTISGVTLIGVAAHITAASPNGPRFNHDLSKEERIHINNAIWLCANCATLIDREPAIFPVNLLNAWKLETENKTRKALIGMEVTSLNLPRLEADIIYTRGARLILGYSQKNFEIYGNEPILVGSPIIAFYELQWRYEIVIYNNSKFNAYNVRLEPVGEIKFDKISEVPKINNIPSLENIILEARTSISVEMTAEDADKIHNDKFPSHLEGLQLKIIYFNEERKEISTLITINNGDATNNYLNAYR